MRRFADMVGISNPYMSQIERGLREPSEKVLDAIARDLSLSAEVLYERAGMTDSAEEDRGTGVLGAAIREDPRLNARQRQALLEVYDAFVGAQAPRRRRRRATGGGLDLGAGSLREPVREIGPDLLACARARHQADVAARTGEVRDVLAGSPGRAAARVRSAARCGRRRR